jgi:hypothetical protein
MDPARSRSGALKRPISFASRTGQRNPTARSKIGPYPTVGRRSHLRLPLPDDRPLGTRPRTDLQRQLPRSHGYQAPPRDGPAYQRVLARGVAHQRAHLCPGMAGTSPDLRRPTPSNSAARLPGLGIFHPLLQFLEERDGIDSRHPCYCLRNYPLN